MSWFRGLDLIIGSIAKTDRERESFPPFSAFEETLENFAECAPVFLGHIKKMQTHPVKRRFFAFLGAIDHNRMEVDRVFFGEDQG